MQQHRLAVAYDPAPTAARVAGLRRGVRSRIFSALLSAVLLGVLIYFFGQSWGRGWVIAMIVLWGVSTVVGFLISFLSLRRARKDLAAIGQGDAFRIDGVGVEVLHGIPTRARWQETTAVRLSGRHAGRGPDVVLEVGGRPAGRVPLSFLDVTPSALDSALFAYSLGRFRLDASHLDRML